MKKRNATLKVGTAAVFFLAGGGGLAAAVRSSSPSGQYEAAFEAPLPSIAEDPYAPKLRARERVKRYQFAVYRSGSDTAIALTDYYDVFGTSSTPKATSPDELLKGLRWSPQEDFVILPAPSGSPSGVRKIVNLSRNIPWIAYPFPLDPTTLVWRDRYRAVGVEPDSCAPNVDQFDGVSGKFTPLFPAASPEGYRIEKVDGKRLLLKKIIGDCASAAEKKDFRPECVELDLSFDRRGIVPCP